MLSPTDFPSSSEIEICAHVKQLGYAASSHLRLYGEEFEVVSDPFPEADGIAVRVTTKTNSNIRVLRIPMTVLQSAKNWRVRKRVPASVANKPAPLRPVAKAPDLETQSLSRL